MADVTLVETEELSSNRDIRDAMWPSTRVALLGTIVSLVLESMAEATVSRSRIFGCGPTSVLVVLPIALPGIVTRLVLRSGSRNSTARGAMLAVALSASSPSW